MVDWEEFQIASVGENLVHDIIMINHCPGECNYALETGKRKTNKIEMATSYLCVQAIILYDFYIETDRIFAGFIEMAFNEHVSHRWEKIIIRRLVTEPPSCFFLDVSEFDNVKL